VLCIIRPGNLQEGKAIHPFELKDTLINLEIQDTRGKEMVSDLDPSYFEGADAAMLVFDLTAPDSFYAIPRWNSELKQYVGDIPKLLIGNKADRHDARRISREQAERLAQQVNALYFETSISVSALPFGQRQVRGGRGIFKALRILIEQLVADKH